MRVIEEATLSGIGIVRAPSYGQSRVEARGRSRRMLRAHIPADTDLACECSGVGCKFARFAQEALEGAMAEVFERMEREAVASFGSYAAPLASAGRGTMRGRAVEGGADVEIDIPRGAAGDAVIAAHEDAGVVVRPFLDGDRSQGQAIPREDGTNAMAYTAASVRAFIVSATDARDGWPEPQLVATPEELASACAPRSRRRRLWL